MRIQFKYSLLTLLLLLLIPLTAFAESTKWYDYKTGEKLAREKNKKLYIYFYSNSCPWCTRMEKDTLSKEKISSYLNQNFISVKVNVSKDMDTTRKYNIGPIPANIFMESDVKTQIYNRPGYVQKEIFYNIIEAIKLEKYK